MSLNSSFWSKKRVLLTGHTGFKGSWLALWLTELGAAVTGISLEPETTPNLFTLARVAEVTDSRFSDIRNQQQLRATVKEARPEIVFHLAAQPMVRRGYQQPLDTLATNIMGTANLLEALRAIDSVRVAVVITTDKVYRNMEWPYPYRENDPLGGHDPYSASKAAAELVVSCYRQAYLAAAGAAVATARAGNVIGGGDWSADRLIPDAVRAWQLGRPLEIRRPQAVRPWQHVLEPLAGYLLLAEKLWFAPELAKAYNFGPDTGSTATVREVIELARQAYGSGEVCWGDGTEGPHEAGLLALEIARARAILGISPKWTLSEAVQRTMRWYRRQAKEIDCRDMCLAEIGEYTRGVA